MTQEFDDSTANAMETAGYIGAGVAAMLAMWTTVRDSCYRQIKKTGVLDEATDKRLGALKKLGKMDSPDFFKELGEIRNVYRVDIDNAYTKLGIKTYFDRFRVLTKYEKAGVIGLALTVASVGIGAISSIRSQRKIADQLEALRDESLQPRTR